jgi:RluA family pseudouridine synthase
LSVWTLAERNRHLQHAMESWPATEPYDNGRPLNVPGRLAGRTLLACVTAMYPQIAVPQWQQWFADGHIRRGNIPVEPETVVREGEQFVHVFPDWVEPTVNTNIEILWEDDAVIAVYKPAPLPVHPSGRFNRNTLTAMLRSVYAEDDLRVVHRLDANTTGVLLLARTAEAADQLRKQFLSESVEKKYYVKCLGHPHGDRFSCDQPIAKHGTLAGLRTTDPGGQPASTDFQVHDRVADGTSLLVARPRTGRTNQIRIHLWSLGMPVVGDPAYLAGRKLGATQTLRSSDPPLCLHATTIAVSHPTTGQELLVRSPDPGWWTAGPTELTSC